MRMDVQKSRQFLSFLIFLRAGAPLSRSDGPASAANGYVAASEFDALHQQSLLSSVRRAFEAERHSRSKLRSGQDVRLSTTSLCFLASDRPLSQKGE